MADVTSLSAGRVALASVSANPLRCGLRAPASLPLRLAVRWPLQRRLVRAAVRHRALASGRRRADPPPAVRGWVGNVASRLPHLEGRRTRCWRSGHGARSVGRAHHGLGARVVEAGRLADRRRLGMRVEGRRLGDGAALHGFGGARGDEASGREVGRVRVQLWLLHGGCVPGRAADVPLELRARDVLALMGTSSTQLGIWSAVWPMSWMRALRLFALRTSGRSTHVAIWYWRWNISSVMFWNLRGLVLRTIWRLVRREPPHGTQMWIGLVTWQPIACCSVGRRIRLRVVGRL